MAIARVVEFEGVPADRIEQLKADMESGERPEGLPATEFILLYDTAAQKSLALVFFDNEEDYATGNATLDAMPTGDTPGRRVSVSKYDVATRMSV
jgi:hypothetical protein